MAGLTKQEVLGMTIEQINTEFATLSQGENVSCTNCTTCKDCFQCADCVDCSDCNKCADCTNCKDCQHCVGCTDCQGCVKCYMCDGLVGKKHYILNVRLTKEEFIDKMTELGF
jgi:hypothetical protein